MTKRTPEPELEALVRRHGFAGVARAAGVSEGTVRHWVAGRRAPTAASKAKLARAAAALTTPPVGSGPAAPSGGLGEAPSDVAPDDPKTLALRLVQRLEGELADARGNASYTPRERAALSTAATSALRLYSRLSGSLEVTQATILRSAAWGRILRTFEQVFARHPEAADALAELGAALQELGE